MHQVHMKIIAGINSGKTTQAIDMLRHYMGGHDVRIMYASDELSDIMILKRLALPSMENVTNIPQIISCPNANRHALNELIKGWIEFANVAYPLDKLVIILDTVGYNDEHVEKIKTMLNDNNKQYVLITVEQQRTK